MLAPFLELLIRHLINMKVEEHGMYRFCELEEETPLHLLIDCVVVADEEISHLRLGSGPSLKPRQILKFIKKVVPVSSEQQISVLGKGPIRSLIHPQQIKIVQNCPFGQEQLVTSHTNQCLFATRGLCRIMSALSPRPTVFLPGGRW